MKLKTYPDEPDHTQTECRVQDDREVKVLLSPQLFFVLFCVCDGLHPIDILDRDG